MVVWLEYFQRLISVRYTIYDTKLVNLLQYYYLKQNGLDVGFNKNHKFLLINKFKFKKKTSTEFIVYS